jgi:hypothetical protein
VLNGLRPGDGILTCFVVSQLSLREKKTLSIVVVEIYSYGRRNQLEVLIFFSPCMEGMIPELDSTTMVYSYGLVALAASHLPPAEMHNRSWLVSALRSPSEPGFRIFLGRFYGLVHSCSLCFVREIVNYTHYTHTYIYVCIYIYMSYIYI